MNNALEFLISKTDFLINSILLITILGLISYIMYNVLSHFKYLHSLNEDETIETEYLAFKTFKMNFRNLVQYSIRKFVKYYKFTLHYIHFYIIKSLSFVQSLINTIYAKLRNNFVEKSIGDKKYVAHFWGNLKEFKKEMDKE